MKCTVLLLLAFSLLKSLQGQSPPGPVLKEPKGGVDDNCVYRNKYTESQRRKIYPFDVSDTIKLVSFRSHNNENPVRKGQVIEDSLIEHRVLSKEEIARLTDILYNYVPRRPGNIASVNQCFYPRNAILFIDKESKLREYVLICFHCRRAKASSYIKMGELDDCEQKFEMIRQFFISCDVQFGTDPTVNVYPGENDD